MRAGSQAVKGAALRTLSHRGPQVRILSRASDLDTVCRFCFGRTRKWGVSLQGLPITLERCDTDINADLTPARKVVVVPKTLDGYLSERQLVDYVDQRMKFLSWLLNVEQ